MKWHLWGTDFRRTSQEFRARLYVAPENRLAFFKKAYDLGFTDFVYLATCNRIEFYTTAPDHFANTRSLWLRLLDLFGLPEEAFYQGYHLEGKSALRHLLRLACSLESLVIGESQILGQLKDCLQFIKENRLPLDSSLDRAFATAFETAKAVRTHTNLSEKSVSVASLGLSRVQEKEAHFPLRKVVVVGRGPISLAVLNWMEKNRPGVPVVWANRSVDRLSEYAESKNVEIVSLYDLLKKPCDFSHLFTATGSEEAIFTDTFFEKLSRHPKMVFDFAQPSDVSILQESFPHVDVVGLESLEAESRRNADARKSAVAQAEQIIDRALESHCYQQKRSPYLKEFSTVEEAFFTELRRSIMSLPLHVREEHRDDVQAWAEKLLKKNLHHSREHLKEMLQEIFQQGSQTMVG